MNIHAEYTDGKYANVDQVIADLIYLGIHYVRDANLDPGNQGQTNYERLAQAGLKFNLFLQGGHAAEGLERISAFELRYPGAIASIEGPNEVNNFPVTYAGKNGDAGASAFQAALYHLVKSHPVLKLIPVYSVTSWPEFPTDADFANAHPYPKGRAQPRETLLDAVRAEGKNMVGKPVGFTEAGYYTLPTSEDWGGVDELGQAKMTLNLLCDAAQLGVRRTYIYELLDAYPDPENKDSSRHFGLFALDNRPKLAAVALHNLTTILADSKPVVDRSGSKTSDIVVTNMPPAGEQLALRKQSGATDLILWSEPQIWDPSRARSMDAVGSSVTVDFGRIGVVRIFDPLAGPNAIVKSSHTSDITVEITDHPLVLEFEALNETSGASTRPAGVPATAD